MNIITIWFWKKSSHKKLQHFLGRKIRIAMYRCRKVNYYWKATNKQRLVTITDTTWTPSSWFWQPTWTVTRNGLPFVYWRSTGYFQWLKKRYKQETMERNSKNWKHTLLLGNVTDNNPETFWFNAQKFLKLSNKASSVWTLTQAVTRQHWILNMTHAAFCLTQGGGRLSLTPATRQRQPSWCLVKVGCYDNGAADMDGQRKKQRKSAESDRNHKFFK